jgi:hypothetical protein
MIIPGQFGFNCPSGLREEVFWNIFPIGSNVKLSPAVGNAFFSETIYQTQFKLHRNVHWIILYKVNVFCSDMKSKMVATAGLSLTLDPMGKLFQNANLIEAWLYMNVHCLKLIIWTFLKILVSIVQVVSVKKSFKTFSHKVQC